MSTHPLVFVDNYDSFTYNLVQYFQMLGKVVVTLRNNITTDAIIALKPCALVIGPGPGNPSSAGNSKGLMTHFAGKLPVLGVCLGHQCLGEIYGGKTVRAQTPMHGKQSYIRHNEEGLFKGLKQDFKVTRYHSLLVERETLPDCLEVTAQTHSGEIMALRHKQYRNLQSVQFHPESVLSEFGLELLGNFLKET